MKSFEVQEKTKADCEKKVRELYGDAAVIMTEETVRAGGFLGLFTHSEVRVKGTAPDLGKYSPSIVKRSMNDEDEKAKILASTPVKPDSAMMEILREVKSLKEEFTGSRAVYANTEHPSLKQLRVILEKNDFSNSYTEKLLERVKAELPLQTLDDFYETQQQVLEWIGESITLCKAEPTIFAKKPAIIIIIGPTGAGKTTTVAKLAANFYFAKREVVLITIDFFKLSAKEQLQEYGRILKIPTLVAYNKSDVERELALRADGVDIIIVDTIGNSPKETARIGDMQDTLSGCGKNAQTFLVIPASMKTRDIIELMKQYEPFSYSSVIVTKIDETSNTGSIISALEERGKSVSYITFGQKVPGFLKEATVQDFLMRLDDFDIDRARLEKKWGAAE